MTRNDDARIGGILIQHGEMTEGQVTAVLEAQRRDGRPFGELAQRMFSVGRKAIERAWTTQYLQFGTRVDLQTQRIDTGVLTVLNRRQAWQMRILPLHRQRLPLARRGLHLVVATTEDRLPRAATFAWRRLDEPVHLVVASAAQIEQYLQQYYPWPAMRRPEVVVLPGGGRFLSQRSSPRKLVKNHL
jgi:hypothetical protein